MTRLKICGLTQEEDVEMVDRVADYVGFIVGPHSPRALVLSRAVELASGLSRAVPVLVAAGMDLKRAVDMAIKSGAFRTLQFHGPVRPAEALKATEALTASGIGFAPTILYHGGWIPEHPSRYSEVNYEYLLVDAPKRREKRYEHGLRVPLSAYREAAKSARRMAAAGGVNPDNVRYVISQGVWMVDVSSGVEVRPGVKDHVLVKKIAERVRGRC